jgi:DNA-binding NtrC family response regulator
MAPSILILDDDVHVRESLAMGLEDEDMDVFQVGSSEDALDFLEKQRVDLVIVDLRLPGMNGTDFIDAARAQWADLLFIIYTGSPEFRIPASLASVPCVSNSVFLKPLPDCECIVAEIRRMLQSKRCLSAPRGGN